MTARIIFSSRAVRLNLGVDFCGVSCPGHVALACPGFLKPPCGGYGLIKSSTLMMPLRFSRRSTTKTLVVLDGAVHNLSELRAGDVGVNAASISNLQSID